MIENRVVKVLSYETPTLQETLSRYAKEGYKLVSTEMANNEHNTDDDNEDISDNNNDNSNNNGNNNRWIARSCGRRRGGAMYRPQW